MKKLTVCIMSIFFLSGILTPLPGDAVSAKPPVQTKVKPITAAEKKLINQPRLFEDSSENTPFKASKKSPEQSIPGSGPQVEAESYILIDDRTGQVLAHKAKDQPRSPASMTKMMTAYLVLDQIRQKKIHWDDIVTVSKRAAAIDEAQIFLLENEQISVKELFTGVMVQSGNDAAVALAEYVSGSEEEFVKQMNRKAIQLGLKNTHFNNASGLDHKDYPDPPNSPGDHLMSAADTAKLGQSLLHTHPEILKFSTITHYTFHPGTDREQKVKNWNRMLPGLEHEYKGVDGIKTGSTMAAGYCFTGTIKQGKRRLFSVVMGAQTVDKRFTETAKLYDYALKKSKQVKKKSAKADESHTVKYPKAG